MPAPHDLDPPSMDEDERLAKRRYHAYHAFESEYAPVSRESVLSAQFGTVWSDQPDDESADADAGDGGDAGDAGGDA